MEKDLRRLKGIGPKAIQKLAEMNVSSLEDLASRPMENDYEGWAFFGRKDEWKRLVLQARAFLLPKYVEPSMVGVENDFISLNGASELGARIFTTNVLELSENAVVIDKYTDRMVIKPRGVAGAGQHGSEYYKMVFEKALERVPEKLRRLSAGSGSGGAGKINPLAIDSDQGAYEIQNISFMQKQFDVYLKDLLEHRLHETVNYGEEISIQKLTDYLKQVSGTMYFDSLLSLVQQYALCDAPIESNGQRKMSTGFNLALLGAPGTGKTFATVDLIVGNENDAIPAHGLPGMNRYCGGMTVAQFVRIAQAYQGKKFNFVVTEFNDWFKYPGMVENLKQALERKWLKYETVNETIGPYKFDSFFSVNYNTEVFDRGYEVTIADPNFNAVEDRMLCRLHRMSKERFLNIIDSLESHLLGETEYNAQRIRDHLTLVYAIQTENPLVKNMFEAKPVELETRTVSAVTDAAKKFIGMVNADQISFSPRLIKRTIQMCCSLSLLKYFQTSESEKTLKQDEEALNLALAFFAEEVCVRSQEKIDPKKLLEKIKEK
ncbi:Uncharacterised protein [Candidatus Gugararchaeum adminiculabundum]|nr:Uncharacterised protein [Candidatus Gugararchaeum adminiculabundum]